MNERGIGSVVVTDDNGVVGIFTERDMVRRVVAKQRDPLTTTVREVMSSPVVTCPPNTLLNDCGIVMTEKEIRRLPISDDGKLVGMITSRDLIIHEAGSHEGTIEDLVDYIFDKS
jgi:CBS domain-containing protein